MKTAYFIVWIWTGTFIGNSFQLSDNSHWLSPFLLIWQAHCVIIQRISITTDPSCLTFPPQQFIPAKEGEGGKTYPKTQTKPQTTGCALLTGGWKLAKKKKAEIYLKPDWGGGGGQLFQTDPLQPQQPPTWGEWLSASCDLFILLLWGGSKLLG